MRKLFDLDAEVMIRRPLLITARVPPIQTEILSSYDVPAISQ